MSELSELYAQDQSASSLGKVTYQWSNPSTPSPYYQHYGEGTIDQSIFVTQFPKGDPYVYGSAISLPDNNKNVSVSQNKFGKLNNCMCYSSDASAFSFDTDNTSLRLLTKAKFSPSPVGYPISYSQRFYINIEYGNLLVIPSVSAVLFNVNNSPTIVSNIYIDDLLNYLNSGNYTSYLIIGILIRNIKRGSTTLGNNYIRLNYIQFAGELPNVKLSSVGWGYYDCITDGAVSGVFLTPGDYSIFNTPQWSSAGKINAYGGCAYDLNALCSQTTASNGNTYMGLPDINQVFTIMDRLGYFWSKNPNSDATKLGSRCDDPDVRCPIIDTEHGNLVTSTVLSGAEIAEYAITHPESNMSWDVAALDGNGTTYEEIRTEYAEPEQPTTEPADEINLNEPVISTSGGNSVWLMNEQKLKEFFTFLWNPEGNIFDDIVHGCALFGENPMESVVSCRFFPLDLAEVFGSKFDSQYRRIMFGRYPSPVIARLLRSSNVVIYDLGSFYFNDSGMFNDFRDYEPYSSYSIYIPFVGITPVSAIECINTTITIKMIIDLVTGACTAVIFTNGVPYKYLDGMIGIEVPVTGRNMAQYGSNILRGAMAGVAAGAKGALGAAPQLANASRNLASQSKSQLSTSAINFGTGHSGYGAAGGAAGVAEAVGAIATSPAVIGASFGVAGAALGAFTGALAGSPEPQSSGSNVPAMGLAKPLFTYFIVQRADSWVPENFAKLYGRPLQEGGKVGDFLGYSEFGNINIDGIRGATNSEKTLISELLTKGVIL